MRTRDVRSRTDCCSTTATTRRVRKCLGLLPSVSRRYDDQQDYFDLNDKWSGKKMDPNAYKPVYEERSKVRHVTEK